MNNSLEYRKKEAEEIDAWARANIPEYRIYGEPQRLNIGRMIRQAKAYGIDNVYNLVHLAKLYIRTNIDINFSQSANWNKNKASRDDCGNVNSFTYNGAIYLNPYLTKPANSVLIHELTRANEQDWGTWKCMTLEGTKNW